MKDPYEVLGVSRDASPDDIKKAYKKLAMETHPDKTGGDDVKFKEISEAYQAITNPTRKSGGNYGYGGGDPFSDLGNFEDLFSRLGFDFFGNGSRKATNSKRVVNNEVRLNLTFEESCFGLDKDITFSYHKDCGGCDGTGAKDKVIIKCTSCNGLGHKPHSQGNMVFSMSCNNCYGTGKVPKDKCNACQGKKTVLTSLTKKITIPGSINSGDIVRLAIDSKNVLSVQMMVVPSKEYKRLGYDIHSPVSIDLKTALLGGQINVKTIHGEKIVKLKECTQHNMKVKLAGCGSKNSNNNTYGDHILTVEVKLPGSLTQVQKDKLQEVFNEE